MTDPTFDSRTPRFDLPLLFAGQAQKEIYVNETLARIDALLHAAIEGELASPPASPTDGTAWLVAVNPSGEWAGRAGAIAAHQSGNWLFFPPHDGMSVVNRATGQVHRYANGWHAPSRPTPPAGGTTTDNEARAAIVAILAALASAGVLPN